MKFSLCSPAILLLKLLNIFIWHIQVEFFKTLQRNFKIFKDLNILGFPGFCFELLQANSKRRKKWKV